MKSPEEIDLIIIILFLVVFGLIVYTMYHITVFMKTIETCDDDFNIINTCHCVPCSWKDAEEINHNPCITANLT